MQDIQLNKFLFFLNWTILMCLYQIKIHYYKILLYFLFYLTCLSKIYLIFKKNEIAIYLKYQFLK